MLVGYRYIYVESSFMQVCARCHVPIVFLLNQPIATSKRTILSNLMGDWLSKINQSHVITKVRKLIEIIKE